MNITDESFINENNNSTWFPIVTNVLIILSIFISLAKQYLNNGKHANLKDTMKVIMKKALTEDKKDRKELATEGNELITEEIELNVPENLKSSVQKQKK